MNDQEKNHLNERQNKIMEFMHQQNAIPVSQLATMLKVSEVTIRKDLSFLEQQNLLYRVHGSAILINRYTNNKTIVEKKRLCINEKRAIGKYAATLIMPRDTIIIASGTTMQSFADQIIVKESLTVISSSFEVSSSLVAKENVDVIQLGGLVRESSMAVMGPFAEQMLSGLSCSKLFLGVDGIDLDFGITTTNHMEAHLHRIMVDTAQKTIVLADHTKFNRRGYSQICSMDQVDEIVTDSEAPHDIVEKILDAGIDVTIVDNEGIPIKI